MPEPLPMILHLNVVLQETEKHQFDMVSGFISKVLKILIWLNILFDFILILFLNRYRGEMS